MCIGYNTLHLYLAGKTQDNKKDVNLAMKNKNNHTAELVCTKKGPYQYSSS